MSNSIPQVLAGKFERMKKEVFLLQIHRQIYHQLFHHSQERIDILNRCGHEVFICLQISFETEMLMLLSRITDAPGIKDQQRLSFQQFHKLIEQSGDHALSKKLRNSIKKIRKKREELQDHRNKLLAHLDLKTAMEEGPSPDRVTLKKIDEAIAYLHEYMRTFEQHYQPDTEVIYETSFLVNSAGDALVSILEKGLRAEELIGEDQFV